MSEYTGINLLAVDNLDLVEFLVYLRDARIYNLSQTEDGQEYLDNAWRIKQTAPDRQALRRKHGRGGESD